MKRASMFSVAADSALAAVCAFIFVFTAVRFYTDNPPLGAGLGVAAFAAFGSFTFLRLYSRRKSAIESRADDKRTQEFKNYLCTLHGERARVLTATATGGKAIDDVVILNGRAYVPLYLPEPLSANDICRATAFDSKGKKCVICNGASPEGMLFAEGADIEIMDSSALYAAFEERGLLPEKLPAARRGRKFLTALKAGMNRRAARRLMVCGLCLTAFSYVTFFPLYYIISGGIMLALAGFCAVFGAK